MTSDEKKILEIAEIQRRKKYGEPEKEVVCDVIIVETSSNKVLWRLYKKLPKTRAHRLAERARLKIDHDNSGEYAVYVVSEETLYVGMPFEKNKVQ